MILQVAVPMTLPGESRILGLIFSEHGDIKILIFDASHEEDANLRWSVNDASALSEHSDSNFFLATVSDYSHTATGQLCSSRRLECGGRLAAEG